jgi:hypothetical protein
MFRVHGPEDLESVGRDLQLGITIHDGIPPPRRLREDRRQGKNFCASPRDICGEHDKTIYLLPIVRQMLKIRQPLLASPKFFQ